MKLGMLSAPFERWSLEEVVTWAAAQGFDQVEVAAWPRQGGQARRYAGTCHLDVEALSQGAVDDLHGMLAQAGVSISALAYYPNHLDPDPAVREAAVRHTHRLIDAAAATGVPLVTTFIGGDPSRDVDSCYAEVPTVIGPLVDHAREVGVRLAIENCPMLFSADEWPGGKNIAYSPRIWRRLIDDFGPTIGLNLDPSHLLWLMIDAERAVREFAEHIYHVHVKDLQIDRDGLYERSVLSGGMGWQVPRLPGLGEVDWRRFIAALYEVGYDGVLCIEHEDRRFEGTDELLAAGFRLARDHIRPLVPQLDAPARG